MYNIVDLEAYVTSKGYSTNQQLKDIQFEVGERIKQNEAWQDLYSEVLIAKIKLEEDNLELFKEWVVTWEEQVLKNLEQEYLNEIVD